MGELYGEVNKLTLEWNDGLMAITVRHCVKVHECLTYTLYKNGKDGERMNWHHLMQAL